MGCDIHGWVEKRVDGKWIGYRPLKDRDRNYDRFGALAGVRGLGPPQRGLPDDISETAKNESEEWGSDGHSHSWIPLKDALKIFTEHRYGDDKHYSAYQAFDVDIDDEADFEKYRLVFWFDS